MAKKVAKILAHMLRHPERSWYSIQLTDETGIRSGTTYPVLAGLEARGIISSDWDGPTENWTLRRRVYRLVDIPQAQELLGDVHAVLAH